jgi:GAF domain-containing protein
MSILSMSSSRPLHEVELEQITQLAVTLSAQLARVHVDGIAPAIGDALQRVAAVTRVETCECIEFGETGTVARAHGPTRSASVDQARPQTRCSEGWLVARLARGELVAIARPEECPREALEHGGATGSILGVPASIAGQVVSALVMDGGRLARRWQQPLVERLQLISEILGAALQRLRQETVLRSSLAEIERLNARLEADNVYLKEEIKSYHDFDDIVGESV